MDELSSIIDDMVELEFISRFIIYDKEKKKKNRKLLKKLIQHLNAEDLDYCFEEDAEFNYDE